MFARILLFIALSLTALAVRAESPAAHEYKLDNGLKLIVKEDHRSPVVVSQVWYKVGSSYEHDGITGLSHALEHMMFKGTKQHPAGEFSRIISVNGGRENAFTGADYTAYFQQLEKSRLQVSFELESDRMRNLTLPKDEFAKELKVVMEERRMRTDDQPQALTHEQFHAAAFVNNPYRMPVIGWMDDLENMKIEDLRQWYKTWYAPNNATVVVVGDVNPDEVYKLAKKYFGPLKPSVIPEQKPRHALPQKGIKRITVRTPAELPYLIMGYQAPVLRTAKEDWEPYALEVLTGILDGGESARFAKSLVRDTQIASNTGAGYNLYGRHDDLVTFDGTPAQGHTVEELEKALRNQVKQLQDTPVTQEELDRIKAQVIAGKIYERDSVFYQAMQIGTLETVGLNWKVMDEYVDRVRSITPEQIQQVARKYLTDDHLTIAVLEPLPIDHPVMPMTRGQNVR